MNGIHFIDGEWLPAEEMSISVFDLALTRGLAIFDTLRTYQGKPFALSRHLSRFEEGLSKLSIKLDLESYNINEIIKRGMELNKLPDAVIRLNATMGVNEGRLSSSKPVFYVMFLPINLPDKSQYQAGQTLKTFMVERTLPQVKTINYVSAKLGLEAGDKIGADDALYLDRKNNVLETTISNVFFIKGDKYITPKSDAILNGVTRQLLIELLTKQGASIEERDININEINQFDEALACSTIKEVMAVTRIDDIVISETAGDRTMKLAHDFKEYANEIS